MSTKFGPVITVWISKGIYALVISKRKYIWTWFKNDHKQADDDLFMIVFASTITIVAPNINWIVALSLYAVSDICLTQLPEDKAYSDFQSEHIAAPWLDHFSQFCATQFSIVSFTRFNKGSELPVIRDFI